MRPGLAAAATGPGQQPAILHVCLLVLPGWRPGLASVDWPLWLAGWPGSSGLSWAGLGNSYFWIDPVKDIAGIYTTQILPFCDEKSLPLFLDFETATYDGR